MFSELGSQNSLPVDAFSAKIFPQAKSLGGQLPPCQDVTAYRKVFTVTIFLQVGAAVSRLWRLRLQAAASL